MSKTGVLAEPPLVGREKELEELDSLIDYLVEGKGRTVFVSGEAGSGKTRLVTEFLKRAKKQETTILAGWCLSNVAVPYFPFFEAFNAFFSSEHVEEYKQTGRQPPRSQPKRKAFKGISSEEAEVTAWLIGPSQADKLGRPQAISPQVWKDQTFAAVAKTLSAISSKKPVILFIDDVHWADSASLALIHYIARRITSEKILLLATFRTEQLTPDAEGRPHPLVETLRLMKREDLVREIKIPNLNRTSVSDLAKNMLGGDLQREFAEKLAEESQGNPLTVVETLRMLNERGGLTQEGKQWRLSVDVVGIPPKIKDIILQRLGVLLRDQRRLLDAASVIGEKFNVDLLASILSLDCLEATETLDTIARNTSLVICEGELYRFDHARSRDAVYEEISPALKRGYHDRIAQILEASSKGNRLPFADLAYHYDEAQDIEKALKYSLAAGEEELARWSNAEAAKHFLYVLERVGDSPERFREKLVALEGLGDAYFASDSFSLAVGVFDQLASLQTGADKLRALRKAMFAAFYLGDIPLLARLTKKAEENATADRLEAARVLHQKARVIGIQGDILTCVRISEEALKIFEEEYALSDAAWILFTIGANAGKAERGAATRGLAAALRSIALYDELGDIRSQLEAYLYAGFAFSDCGAAKESIRMLGKVIELNEKSRIGDYIHLIPTYAYLSFFRAFSPMTEQRGDSLRVTQFGQKICDEKFSPEALMDIVENDKELKALSSDSISMALKALEYAEKTDSSLYLGIIYEFLTMEYAFAGNTVRMEEYFGKLMSLPKDVLSNAFSRDFLKPAKAVYYAGKNEFEKSNKIFSEIFQEPIYPHIRTRELPHRFGYAWALSRQGRMDEAEFQREQIPKIADSVRVSVQEMLGHVNVHAGLMILTHPEVNQMFEARLDLVNVSRSLGSIVKVENLLVPGLAVVDVSPNCLVRGEVVEFKDGTISPFEVKTVKLTFRAAKPGVLHLNPTVTYFDDLGETKINSIRTFTITVQRAPPKYEVLPGRITTGSEELDALLLGGIPENYAIMLTAPSSDERSLLIKRFLEAGIEAGETTFYVTAEAGIAKALAEDYPSSFYLLVCNPQADAMIQNMPNVYKLKGIENLTEIDIALTKAFRMLKPSTAGPKRICIKIVSDVLLQHHAITTRKWLSALLPNLKQQGFTVLAVINPYMHPQEEMQAILGLFEGEIRISEKETEKGNERVLRVRRLFNQKYLESELCLTAGKVE